MLSIINFLILTAIAGIHFYWAFGGTWAIDVVLPEMQGKKAFTPSPLITILVAFVFFVFAMIYLKNIAFVDIALPAIIQNYGLKCLGIIFLVRAIGDFRYVGFTKTIKDSKFAKLDTKFYSPLCLYLGISTFIIIYL